MKLTITGPPHVARNPKTKRRMQVFPCNDMIMRSRKKLADMVGIDIVSMAYRIKEYGPFDPKVFSKKRAKKQDKTIDVAEPQKKPKMSEVAVPIDHEAAVNAYIPEAEKYADKLSGGDASEWNRLYFQRMNELTRAAGLRR